MIKVGITGGIGSGKTSVCRIFELFDIPVYYADARAKWLMHHNQKLKREIQDLFGSDIYKEDGLDRKKLAGIVFNDKTALSQLNALVHPAVAEDTKAWFEDQSNAPFALKEAALIFEVGGEKSLDKVITVFAPQETRLDRVTKRDQTDRKAILARMKNQMNEMDKIAKSDYVIINDGNHSLINQAVTLYHELSELDQSIQVK